MLDTRGYGYISSATTMLKDLNWRPLVQRCIDSRLRMILKVTYDLVAYPSISLVRNTRVSRHIHSLAYRQIRTIKAYYSYHRQDYYPLEHTPCQYVGPSHPGTVCQW